MIYFVSFGPFRGSLFQKKQKLVENCFVRSRYSETTLIKKIKLTCVWFRLPIFEINNWWSSCNTNIFDFIDINVDKNKILSSKMIFNLGKAGNYFCSNLVQSFIKKGHHISLFIQSFYGFFCFAVLFIWIIWIIIYRL